MLKVFSLFALSAFSVSSIFAQTPDDTSVEIGISKEAIEKAPPAKSTGFSLKQTRFDASADLTGEKSRSGAVFQSFKPGNVWHGELPGFVPPKIEIGGRDRFPCTDVYEDGPFLYAHYGLDHYKTQVVVVIDQNRHEVLRLTAYSQPNISRTHYDSETEIVYYTIEEANTGTKANAMLYAFSLREKKQLWRSDAGIAHGNFITCDKHIVTHYGFTGEDDFICVIDKGNGKTLKKHKIKTAASALIRDGETIIAPCYEGVVEVRFGER